MMASENTQEQPGGSCVDPVLLSLLACPACHGPLEERQALLTCAACGTGYPVRDGIPVMLVGEAVPLDHAEGSGAGPPAGGEP